LYKAAGIVSEFRFDEQEVNAACAVRHREPSGRHLRPVKAPTLALGQSWLPDAISVTFEDKFENECECGERMQRCGWQLSVAGKVTRRGQTPNSSSSVHATSDPFMFSPRPCCSSCWDVVVRIRGGTRL
jgi:hypothetical protein